METFAYLKLANPGDNSPRREGVFHCDPELNPALRAAGLNGFEALWALPRNFVDAVNHRRGGWSAVSRLSLESDRGPRTFYVKRQQDQLRRSPTHPLGRLTYQFELAAIHRNQCLGLPAVNVVGAGFDHSGQTSRAILITEELAATPLSRFSELTTNWASLKPLLEHAGELLCRMHQQRISHGALYPHHLYLDPASNTVHLIDFERSRRCLLASSAVRIDLSQFLRRAGGLPVEAMEALLWAHKRHFPKLTNQLTRQFHAC